MVGMDADWSQQEEGYSFGESEYEVGHEVRLETARNGEFNASFPFVSTCVR